MEDIKIWALDGSQVEDLKPAGQTDTERLLEDTLVSRPDLLLEDLVLVGRQTPTEGGPLDLLGVDGDGRLVVFELKRDTLTREAVAQVIDYASYLDSMDLDALASYISEKSGSHGINKIDNFSDWYGQQNFEDAESLESLKPLRMVLVGLGVDDTTERMVRFLAENSNMDITLLTFHGFRYDGKTILAKRVEVDSTKVVSPRLKKPSLRKHERRKRLLDLAESLGVSGTFSEVRDLFLNSPNRFSETVRTDSSNLTLRRVWYARIIPESGRVRLFFYPWTIALCPEAFESAKTEIRHEVNHYSNEYGDGIDFLIGDDKREAHKDELTRLVQAVYQAWENQDADGGETT